MDFLFVCCKLFQSVGFCNKCSSKIQGFLDGNILISSPRTCSLQGLLKFCIPVVLNTQLWCLLLGERVSSDLEYKEPLAAMSDPLKGEASWKLGASVAGSQVRREMENLRILHSTVRNRTLNSTIFLSPFSYQSCLYTDLALRSSKLCISLVKLAQRR